MVRSDWPAETSHAEPFASRFRVGLRILIGLFAVLTLIRILGPGEWPVAIGIKAAQFGVLALGFRAFRSRREESREHLLALVLLALLFSLIALDGIAHADGVTPAVLLVMIVLGAAILLPWSVPLQLSVALIASASMMLVLMALTRAHARISGDPLAATLVAIVSSVIVVHQLQRQRAAAARAQVALREEEVRFRSLVQNSYDLVTVVGRDGRLRYVGPSVRHMLGYEPEDMVGRFPTSFVHPEDVTTAENLISGTFHRSLESGVAQVRTRRADGGWVWLEWAARNLIDDPVIRGVVANARDITLRKQVESELRQSSEQLRALSERLRTVREDESARIAREIHDELGQSLTSLKLDLGWLQRQLGKSDGPSDRSAVSEKLRGLSGSVDEIIDTVRRIASELRPGVLDALGLSAAVEWQANEFERRSGVRTRISLSPREIKTDSARSTALFRILQEILTNVARHAEARTVVVSLSQEAESLVLEVSDDGKGLPAEAIHDPSSLGLLGMRERALALGGEVELEGVPGRGTRVRVEIPLHRPSSDTAAGDARHPM